MRSVRWPGQNVRLRRRFRPKRAIWAGVFPTCGQGGSSRQRSRRDDLCGRIVVKGTPD